MGRIAKDKLIEFIKDGIMPLDMSYGEIDVFYADFSKFEVGFFEDNKEDKHIRDLKVVTEDDKYNKELLLDITKHIKIEDKMSSNIKRLVSYYSKVL